MRVGLSTSDFDDFGDATTALKRGKCNKIVKPEVVKNFPGVSVYFHNRKCRLYAGDPGSKEAAAAVWGSPEKKKDGITYLGTWNFKTNNVEWDAGSGMNQEKATELVAGSATSVPGASPKKKKKKENACEEWSAAAQSISLQDTFRDISMAYKKACEESGGSSTLEDSVKILYNYLQKATTDAANLIPKGCAGTLAGTVKTKSSAYKAIIKLWREQPLQAEGMTDANFLNTVSYVGKAFGHPAYFASSYRMEYWDKMVVAFQNLPVAGESASVPTQTISLTPDQPILYEPDTEYEEEEAVPFYKNPVVLIAGGVLAVGTIALIIKKRKKH